MEPNLKRWKENFRARQGRKFRLAVEKHAQERATEMFVEMVKELDNAYTRLGISNVRV